MFWYFLIEGIVALISISFHVKAGKIAAGFTNLEQKTRVLARSQKYNLVSIILGSLFVILALIQVVDNLVGLGLLGQDVLNTFPLTLTSFNMPLIIAGVVILVFWVKGTVDNELEDKLNFRCQELEKYERKIKGLEQKYGKCGMMYGIEESLYDILIRFDESRILYVDGIIIPYDCISFYATNYDNLYEDRTSTVTRTNTGSAIGRGLVGAAVFGPIGALAGVTTAKKESETVVEKKVIKTEIKIVIYLKDYDKPTITVDCGASAAKAGMLATMLDSIIKEKNSSENFERDL